MINYILGSIKKYKSRSTLFVIALVTIFVVLPLSLLTVFQIQVEIDEKITSHARGSYDLLIRPKDSRTQVEKELGVVEENYLGAGDGGITLDEWEAMKALTDVQIAAPVASLGYFNGGKKSLEYALPQSSRWMEVNYETTDGIHRYPLPNKQAYYLLEQEDFFHGFDSVKDSNDPITGTVGDHPLFSLPVPYHLTVGIDLKEEERLTGFDFSSLDEELHEDFMREFGYVDQTQIRPIPIIYLEDARVPIHVTVSTKELDWSTESTISYKEKLGLQSNDSFSLLNQDTPLRLEMMEKFSLLKNESKHSIVTNIYDLSNEIQPFLNKPLRLNDGGDVSEAQSGYENNLYTSRFYRAKPITYDISGDTLAVSEIGEENGVSIYREIEAEKNEQKHIQDVPFVLHPVGSFTTKAHQDTLAASPLGIYQQAPVTLENSGDILHETIAPGSFVSAPAHGLMNIEDAAYIKGEKPIDAVRVRISGIGAYDEIAEAKILHVAQLIQEIGDFEIDIVAGSSPMPITVFVEGIGEVSQPWTSLGVATKITEGWDRVNIIIVSLFVLVSLSYMLNRFLFRRRLQFEERKLLLELGWKKRHIRSFYFGEYSILVLVALFISIGILFVCLFLSLVDWSVFFWLLGVVAFVIVLGVISVFQKDRPLLLKHHRLKSESLLLQNIFYYKRFIILTFIQLMTMTSTVTFVGLSIISTVIETNITNLGSYINDQLLTSFLLVIIASLALSIFTMIESTTSFLTVRQGEIETLRDIGWRKNEILSLYLKESSLWSVLAILLGTGLGILLISIIYTLTLSSLFLAIGLMVFLIILVVLLTYIMIRRYLLTRGGILAYHSF